MPRRGTQISPCVCTEVGVPKHPPARVLSRLLLPVLAAIRVAVAVIDAPIPCQLNPGMPLHMRCGSCSRPCHPASLLGNLAAKRDSGQRMGSIMHHPGCELGGAIVAAAAMASAQRLLWLCTYDI